ncbi:MAG: methionyl-tRNA formyltransferase [Flavobacteriaceae bacterium]|nr:methionyl-tRNA formyltransferase [Flavobacteriaceae bacterium]
MKRDLRIVFMGTPEFALSSLNALLEGGYNVVGVITAPDKPAGRGRKLRPSVIKRYALEKGLTVLQPRSLKNVSFLRALEALKPNLQVVVAFRMLPQAVWELPEFGTFNLHASLLPQYRGAAPINWAIINGETKTGVSTFFIDEKIDTGELILQREVEIEAVDNAGSLHDKLMVVGSELVLETVGLIEQGKAKPIPQKHDEARYPAPKLNPENCRIDWNRPGEEIHNLIRGLSPYPAAWTILYNDEEELRIKIFKTDFRKTEHNLENGALLIDKNTVAVACPDGLVGIMEIQLPGKRKIDIKSLLNGFDFHQKAKLL